MGEKLDFTNRVFEKLCSSESTLFIVFSAKHSSCNKNAVCWEKQKIYEKLWVGFEHGKWRFWVCFFWNFNGFVFCFCVFGIAAKVLSTRVFFFPVFLAFVWWFILVYLGLEGLGVLVVFVFVFLLFRFCFCLFWFWFCFVVGLLLVLLLFCFVVVFVFVWKI